MLSISQSRVCILGLSVAVLVAGCTSSEGAHSDADGVKTVTAGSSLSATITTDAPSTTRAAAAPSTTEATSGGASGDWMVLNPGDSTYPSSVDGFVDQAEIVARVAVAAPAEFLATASLNTTTRTAVESDPVETAHTAIYTQRVNVLEVLKGSASVGRELTVLGVGPNIRNPEVRALVMAGRVSLSDDGLGSLLEGEYLVFLMPSGESTDPDVDFGGTFTLLGDYQGAWPISGSAVVHPDAALPTELDGVLIDDEALESMRDNFLGRPPIEGLGPGLQMSDISKIAALE